jgi:hypothetical protein
MGYTVGDGMDVPALAVGVDRGNSYCRFGSTSMPKPGSVAVRLILMRCPLALP